MEGEIETLEAMIAAGVAVGPTGGELVAVGATVGLADAVAEAVGVGEDAPGEGVGSGGVMSLAKSASVAVVPGAMTIDVPVLPSVRTPFTAVKMRTVGGNVPKVINA